MLLKFTNDKNAEGLVKFAPVIHQTRRKFSEKLNLLFLTIVHKLLISIQIFFSGTYEYLQFDLKIDALSLVGRNITKSQLYEVLVESVCRNLRLIGKSFEEQLGNKDLKMKLPVPMHFKPPDFGHLITIAYLVGSSTQDNGKSKKNLFFYLKLF